MSVLPGRPRRRARAAVVLLAVLVTAGAVLVETFVHSPPQPRTQLVVPGNDEAPAPVIEDPVPAVVVHGDDGVTTSGATLLDGEEVGPTAGAAEAQAAAAYRSTNSPRRRVRCYTGGNAVEFVYAFPRGGRNNLARHRAQFVKLIEQANHAIHATTGGRRTLRVITVRDSRGVCRPRIRAIKVAPKALRTQRTLDGAIAATGRRSKARKYLAFTDRRDVCGVAQMRVDPLITGAWNVANGGPTYARVDADCRTANTVMHEVTHMLGGVQTTAPYATGGHHCRDDHDLMCYNDGRLANKRMVKRCPNSVWELRWDCGRDTYYSPRPKKGTWLARNWNIGASSFLYGGGKPWPTTKKPAAPKVLDAVRTKSGLTVTWKRRWDASKYTLQTQDGKVRKQLGVRTSGKFTNAELRGQTWVYLMASSPNGYAYEPIRIPN